MLDAVTTRRRLVSGLWAAKEANLARRFASQVLNRWNHRKARGVLQA